MTDQPIREPAQIRQDCSRKIRSVETSSMFTAILGCLLGEDWSTPRIQGLYLSPDGMLLARVEGEISHKMFLGAQADLIRNIHGLAKVAELDGDEVGYLLGEVARLKRIE
jgi:hypothetical protein